MRSSHLPVCAVLTVLALCAGLHAGIYYEQELKMPAQPGMPAGVVKQVCYVSGRRMRTESTAMGATGIVILRYDKGVVYQLMPAEKVCMEMPIPKPTPQPAGQEPTVTVTKTGETKKIGKYSCTRYDATVGKETWRFWMTEDVDLGTEMADYWLTPSPGESATVGQEMAKIKGFPIMREMVTPEGTTTMTITEVKKQDIPDSMFEVPEGYQKMSMPMPMRTQRLKGTE